MTNKLSKSDREPNEFKEFAKELNDSKRVEGELLKTFLYSLLSSIIIIGILYLEIFRNIENFIPKYGFYIFFFVLSYSILIPSIRQVRAYKRFACMPGMMIGMTSGMIAGFLPGFFIGATNGMFWGSIFGMSVGIILGVWNGKSCGIMGIMEGLMAGFMGGLMGAMSSVMMLNDNIRAASVIVFIISAVIMISLNYMIYKEMKSNERQLRESQFITIVTSVILTLITALFMVLGPRSAIFT
jgi:hypothetical protein